MENLIYLTVKVLSAVYLLGGVFRFLSGKQAREYWRFMTPKMQVKGKAPVPVPETAPYSMVGKSLTVYLEEISGEKAVEPAFSEDLESIPAYGEEPDITDDDVDDNLNEDRLSGEDRFLPFDAEPDDADFPSSTGMTCEQISEALDVVQGRKTDDAGRQTVARILYQIEGSGLFNFLTAQAENEAVVERLMKEHLDREGGSAPENTRKKRREIEAFDMDRYV